MKRHFVLTHFWIVIKYLGLNFTKYTQSVLKRKLDKIIEIDQVPCCVKIIELKRDVIISQKETALYLRLGVPYACIPSTLLLTQ